MPEMKILYANDWTDSATLAYEILDETISGKYVCRRAPTEMTRLDGSRYLADSVSGLILRDKKDFIPDKVN